MGWDLVDNWQYSRMLRNISRNARLTTSGGGGVIAAIGQFWNANTNTGTRPWLAPKFASLAVASGYKGYVSDEPLNIVWKMLEVISRDIRKIPLTAAEKLLVQGLVENVGDSGQKYRLGIGPTFGSVIGSE